LRNKELVVVDAASSGRQDRAVPCRPGPFLEIAVLAIRRCSRMPALLLAVVSIAPVTTAFAGQPRLVSVERIWDAGGHNAFTDLIRFEDRWWCVFREADGHVRGDGRIRVITSPDGDDWESAALIAEQGIDLRDPKISVMPDGRLMIVLGGSDYGSDYANGAMLRGRQSRVCFSRNGRDWTPPQRVLHEGEWLWRVTWHGRTGYGVAYRTAPREGKPADDWRQSLYRTTDGRAWEFVADLEVPDRPGETTLRFVGDDGRMVAVVRREEGTKFAWIGSSAPPYEKWTWGETQHRLGGPDFVELPNGELWAAGRHYVGGAKTVLFRMDAGKPSLEPALELPSGGDTSYPRLVWHEGRLWMTYYASHEERTSIYLAKIAFE
jgi:hypothetical protein